jgi:hypothetical protein
MLTSVATSAGVAVATEPNCGSAKAGETGAMTPTGAAAGETTGFAGAAVRHALTTRRRPKETARASIEDGLVRMV